MLSARRLKIGSAKGQTVLTYVRTIIPGKDGARGDNDLVILYTESVRIAKVCCLAANLRPWTLCIVGKNLSSEAIAVDLPWIFVALGQNKPEGEPKKNDLIL